MLLVALLVFYKPTAASLEPCVSNPTVNAMTAGIVMIAAWSLAGISVKVASYAANIFIA